MEVPDQRQGKGDTKSSYSQTRAGDTDVPARGSKEPDGVLGYQGGNTTKAINDQRTEPWSLVGENKGAHCIPTAVHTALASQVGMLLSAQRRYRYVVHRSTLPSGRQSLHRKGHRLQAACKVLQEKKRSGDCL